MNPIQGWFVPLLLGLSLQADGAGTAERDAQGWLQEMAKAVRTLNYKGNFVYLHGKNLELMQVEHSVDGNGERERLVSLNGAAREVVRDDMSVTCIAPDNRSILINGRKPPAGGLVFIADFDLDVLSAIYELHLLDQARIADRSTRVVAIIPKDRFRYGYRLFLDQETALPLKTDMLDTQGSVVSQMMFTSITIGPAVESSMPGSLEGSEDYLWEQPRPTRLVAEAEDSDWVFEGLPAGFSLNVKARIPPGAGQDFPIDHFVVSDGVASLSVYAEAQGSEAGLIGSSQMGAVNAFGRQTDGYQITAVGTVPLATVEVAATALRRTRGP